METDPQPGAGRFVSTGSLPDPDDVQRWIAEAHSRFSGVTDGAVSDVYPALERVSPDLFGICVAGVGGRVFGVGDFEREFTIMSVSKPFVFALVCEEFGAAKMKERLGVNSTGLPFNSVEAVERGGGLTNPLVNPGAIAATSFVPGDSTEQKWEFLLDGLSRLAGRRLEVDEEVFASASATNHRNRAIAQLLESFERLGCDPVEAVDLYTRQCSLKVSARDLAVMGSTIAAGGINPQTGERVVDGGVCHYTLAVMLTAGMYETSGEWLYEVGLPAKSGISGGVLTVSPGKGGMGTFSPPLDRAGNSVRGRLATGYLSSRLGLDLLISAPLD